MDYLKELEAELEQAENDVFEIEDITVPEPNPVAVENYGAWGEI